MQLAFVTRECQFLRWSQGRIVLICKPSGAPLCFATVVAPQCLRKRNLGVQPTVGHEWGTSNTDGIGRLPPQVSVSGVQSA